MPHPLPEMLPSISSRMTSWLRSCRLLVLAPLAIVLGCASTGVPLPPSLELPRPPDDLRAVRKGNRVVLSWTVPSQTTDHENIRSRGATLVCRSDRSQLTACDNRVAQLPAPPSQPPASAPSTRAPASVASASFTDVLPADLQQHPMAKLYYMVEALNPNGRSAGPSNQVSVPGAPALPPPTSIHAEVTAEGVAVHWSAVLPAAENSGFTYRYRLLRREPESAGSVVVTELPVVPGAQSFIDRTMQWEKSYSYVVNVMTLLAQDPPLGVEGEDSAPANVITHDTFPPAVPSGLQAVFSGAGQQAFVDLVWAPNTESDLAGYNLYRREEGARPLRLNQELLKTPSYRDRNVVPGRKYFYSASSVDLRGNQSAPSAEAAESVPQP